MNRVLVQNDLERYNYTLCSNEESIMTRSIFCSNCGLDKGPSYHSSGYCKSCKLLKMKLKRAKIREESGMLPYGFVKNSPCQVDGCPHEVIAKFLCSKHYTRQINYGDTSFIKRANKNLTKETFCNNYMPITESGCFLWIKSVDKNDYGMIHLPHKKRKGNRAHRYSYELFKGDIPKGLCVLHKCDIPSCVNPDHLFLGTNRDNNIDKVSKNRQPQGTRTNKAKLTEEIVSNIKPELISGIYYKVLSKKYNIGNNAIYNIMKGKTWKHVKER